MAAPYLSLIENGRRVPSAALRHRLASALRIDAATLLDDAINDARPAVSSEAQNLSNPNQKVTR